MGTEIRGLAASDGIYMGPVRRLAMQPGQRASSGEPATERAALASAIARAITEITELMSRVEGEAQDILGFQVAMLEDDALAASAFAAIAAGTAADAAWADALDAAASGYEASEDEYFRARAADLRDMRDRVLRHLSGVNAQSAEGGAVLLGDDLAPSMFLETDWGRGGAIALSGGSATSHVAMLARARGVPMAVGLGPSLPANCAAMIVDGTQGAVIADPDGRAVSAYLEAQGRMAHRRALEDQYRFTPARLRSGMRIELLVNAAGPDELGHIDVKSCDGIGLMRSEFLFRDGAPLPGEELQYRAYRRFLEWAEGRPVTIRTLDIGGDKPIRGLTPEGEGNPFLGLRGIRLTLANEEVFRTQLKALARAAVHGQLKVMIPMVTVPGEITRTAALFESCIAELRASGIACARPPLGIMAEVPAVAVAPDLFAEAEFFSIGTNDLTQYVTAASRDDARVAQLNDPAHPAVLRLIAQVAQYGAENGVPVSLCGDMASEPKHVPLLIEAGVTSLSVAPARVARIKSVLAEL